jgi:hypothetical protein
VKQPDFARIDPTTHPTGGEFAQEDGILHVPVNKGDSMYIVVGKTVGIIMKLADDNIFKERLK